MKHLYFLLSSLLFLSCTQEGNKEGEKTLPQIEISKIVTENDKTFIEVDGIPFPIYGAQIRLDAFLNCDKMNIDDVEKYFAKGKELGVNCLQVSLCWNTIEPEQNIFDFKVVDKMLEYANKYDIKIELLWFSTNMIGDSFSYLVPQYILKDPNKRLKRNDEGGFWGYYGYCYALILDDPWILENETRAITQLFNHIRYWDEENGKKHPIIAVQIHNEPDGFVRWRIDQKQYAFRDGTPLSKETAWKMTLHSLDAVGRAVKNSSYKVVTRTNLVSGKGIEPFPDAPNAKPRDIFNLEGIDFVSFDPYKAKVNEIVSETSAYASIKGNYPLIAENKGTYVNTASLMLVTSALGGGYNIYDLATSKYFINNTNDPDYIDHGIYTPDLEEKEHTESVRTILKGFIMAAPDIAKTPTENFAVFNVVDDNPHQKIDQQINTTGAKISFETTQGAIGFALDRGDYLLVYTTENTIIQLNNGTIKNIVTGKYDPKGDFIIENSDVRFESDNRININGGILYKIGFASKGLHESNTKQYIGN